MLRGRSSRDARSGRHPIADWLSGKCFALVHESNLVYNTCWEDPRLDREALRIGPDDTMMVITSAGCNVLDYALCGARGIHAVDVNPRQNALLELKMAAARHLDHGEFFSLFGRGRLKHFEALVRGPLAKDLSPYARNYWRRHAAFFQGRQSFYYRGSSGAIARFCNYHVDRIAKIRDAINELFAAQSVEEQRRIYDCSIRGAFWTGFMKKVLGSDAALAMVGVPRQQREQVEHHFGGGISEYIEQAVEAVFARIPIRDNYFWRVYLHGEYTPECCPEYLKRENFARLKDVVDRIRIHTSSVEQFLRRTNARISRYVLLDHMDWLSTYRRAQLESEWQAIVDRAAPNCRVIFRSGGLKVHYVDPIRVRVGEKVRSVGSLLAYHTALAERLHALDRVHTYGSFHVADLNADPANESSKD